MGENPELIAMARRIASERLLKQRYTVLAREVTSGMCDGHDTVQIALAAIIETQERDAALVDEMRTKHSSPTGDEYSCGQWDQGVRIAAAIRSGQHYGKDLPHA